MPQYNHDIMHCAQHNCKKKDQCYRYWLGQEIQFGNANYYIPEKPIEEDCVFFIKREYFE